MAMISRDPFAREELHRFVDEHAQDGRTCAWCGCRRTRKGKPLHRLFRFEVQTDGGSRHAIDKLFCSTACMRAYHS